MELIYLAVYMETLYNSLGDSRVLGLNYSNLQKSKMKIDSLYNELDEYENNLRNNVIVSINSVYGGGSPNLAQAEDYVRNKITSLQKQKDAAKDISSRIHNLYIKATETDEFVKYSFEVYEKQLYKTHPNLKKESNPIKIFGNWIWNLGKGVGNWLYSIGDNVCKAFCSLLEVIGHLFKGEFLEALSCFGSAVGYMIDAILSAPIELLKAGMKYIVNIIPESMQDVIKQWYYFNGGKQLTSLVTSGAKLIIEGALLITAISGLTAITGGGALVVVAEIGSAAGAVSGVISLADSGFDYLHEYNAYQQYKDGDYIGSAVSSDVNSCSDYLRKTNFHDGKINKMSYQNANALDTTKAVSSLVSISSSAYLKHQGVGSFGVDSKYQTDKMKAIGKMKNNLSVVDDVVDVIGDTAGADYGEALNEFAKATTEKGVEHTLDAIYGKKSWKVHLIKKVPSFIKATGKTAETIVDLNKTDIMQAVSNESNSW